MYNFTKSLYFQTCDFLGERNTIFKKNEVFLCHLTHNLSVLKSEGDQKQNKQCSKLWRMRHSW